MIEFEAGIDIGDTKTRIALIKDGLIIRDTTIATHPSQGGKAVLKRIADALTQILEKDCLLKIGIGTAGQVSEEGVIIAATNTFSEWIGCDLKHYFSNKFNTSVSVINDVQAMALGELTYGSGVGYQDILCFAIGTGVGGALISDKHLLRGVNGTCGEVGHARLYPNGRLCPCGNLGCIEAYLAGPSLEKIYYEKTKNYMSAHALFQSDSPLAHSLIECYIQNLIHALVSLVNSYSPEIVIVSGGVAQSLSPYLDHIQTTLQQQVLASNQGVRLKISRLGGDAMVLGAPLYKKRC